MTITTAHRQERKPFEEGVRLAAERAPRLDALVAPLIKESVRGPGGVSRGVPQGAYMHPPGKGNVIVALRVPTLENHTANASV